MTPRGPTSEVYAMAQLETLRRERQAYVARVTELIRRAEHGAELSGYLRLIDNINRATIMLACSVEDREPRHETDADDMTRRAKLAIAA